MSAPASISRRIHFGSTRAIRPPQQPAGRESATGRVPRVARLLALAIRFEELVRDGVVKNYAELARLGYVSRHASRGGRPSNADGQTGCFHQ